MLKDFRFHMPPQKCARALQGASLSPLDCFCWPLDWSLLLLLVFGSVWVLFWVPKPDLAVNGKRRIQNVFSYLQALLHLCVRFIWFKTYVLQNSFLKMIKNVFCSLCHSLGAFGRSLATLSRWMAALGPLLGRCWSLLAALGPLLGRFWPLLGPCRTNIGCS